MSEFPISFELVKDGKVISRHSVRNEEEKVAVIVTAEKVYGKVEVREG